MTQLPLKSTITIGTQNYVWTGPGSILPKDYFIEVMADGSLIHGLGAVGDLTISKQPDWSRPYHLGLHHVKVEDAKGVVLFDQDIPSHWWNSRWSCRAAPLAATITPDIIVGNRRMFPMGAVSKPIGTVNNYQFKGPMDSAGVTIAMGTTGERPDIGLMTDPSALYMLKRNAGPMLAWAQAAGSCPFHYRDENTGKPVDLIKYPAATDYTDNIQGYPILMKGPKNAGGWPNFGGGWVPQQAHECEMSYLAWCATKDPIFLIDLNYAANFMVLDDGALSNKLKLATAHGEYRGIAWTFRNLFMVAAATQDAEKAGTLPAQCHPFSYWKTLLDQELAYYSKSITDPANQLFHLVVPGTLRFAPWQVDYMLASLAFGLLTGRGEWAPLYLFALKNLIDRTSGGSGYPPGWGGGYYLNVFEWKKKADGTYDQSAFDQTKKLDWYNSFLFSQNDPNGPMPTQAQIDKLLIDEFNGGVPMSGFEYLEDARANLVMAQYLSDNWAAFGLPGLSPRQTYSDLDACADAADLMVRKSGKTTLDPRQSYIRLVVSNPAPPAPQPVPVPPVPVPVPQPVPVPPTKTPLQVKVGQLLTLAQEIDGLVNGG